MLPQWMQYIAQTGMEHWVAWAVFGGYLVLTWIVVALARMVLRGIIGRLTARRNVHLNDRLVRSATGPVRFMLLAGGFYLALGALGARIPSFRDRALMGVEFSFVQQAAGAVVILAAAGLVNALVKTGLDWYAFEAAAGNTAAWDRELLPVIRRVVSLVVYFIAISIILKNFGQDITALVTTAGVASLAVALAAQETLSNMLGGFVILVDRPFKVGDVIELTDGKVGEVGEIGLRSTRIRQFDGNALVVPNRDMANSRIINYALPNHRAVAKQTLYLPFETDVAQVEAKLLHTIQQHPEVLRDPAPAVLFSRFGEGVLELAVSFWVESFRERSRVSDEVNRLMLQALREMDLRIMAPGRHS